MSLIDEVAFGQVNTNAQARQTLRYQRRPVGYDSYADFYIYSNHYKAGTSQRDKNRPDIEAISLRNDADSMGQGTHINYAGDFNIRGNREGSSMFCTGCLGIHSGLRVIPAELDWQPLGDLAQSLVPLKCASQVVRSLAFLVRRRGHRQGTNFTVKVAATQMSLVDFESSSRECLAIRPGLSRRDTVESVLRVTLVDKPKIGSRPQDAGSKMLVPESGLEFGTVGGGRIERSSVRWTC